MMKNNAENKKENITKAKALMKELEELGLTAEEMAQLAIGPIDQKGRWTGTWGDPNAKLPYSFN